MCRHILSGLISRVDLIDKGYPDRITCDVSHLNGYLTT